MLTHPLVNTFGRLFLWLSVVGGALLSLMSALSFVVGLVLHTVNMDPIGMLVLMVCTAFNVWFATGWIVLRRILLQTAAEESR